MDKAYVDTVRLMLAVIPDVFSGDVLVMKGGTALNLFVHDMPRLSVDIDLAYPVWDTPRDEALKVIADEIASIAGRLERRGYAVRASKAAGADESRLVVERDAAQVKVEVNLVFRGTVLPPERRPLMSAASDLFSVELSVPSLALPELYGSKLVAALDRQHPRDLFDVAKMYEVHGLSDAAIECFVLYLAGHNRPMHEVLAPRSKDMRREFEASFSGMTREPIELARLDAARDQLLRDIPGRLSSDQRAFLVGVARAAPDWSLVPCSHAQDLPALRWRIANLMRFRESRPDAFDSQVEALEKALGR